MHFARFMVFLYTVHGVLRAIESRATNNSNNNNNGNMAMREQEKMVTHQWAI